MCVCVCVCVCVYVWNTLDRISATEESKDVNGAGKWLNDPRSFTEQDIPVETCRTEVAGHVKYRKELFRPRAPQLHGGSEETLLVVSEDQPGGSAAEHREWGVRVDGQRSSLGVRSQSVFYIILIFYVFFLSEIKHFWSFLWKVS